jgi:hypothetical protein
VIAQTPGEGALYVDRIVVRNVEMKIGHWLVYLAIGTRRLDTLPVPG